MAPVSSPQAFRVSSRSSSESPENLDHCVGSSPPTISLSTTDLDMTLVQPMPYTVVQTLLDPANPPGRNNYWKAEHLDELSDEAIDTIVVHAAKIGSPFTLLVILPMGGAISDVEEDETAIGGRDA